MTTAPAPTTDEALAAITATGDLPDDLWVWAASGGDARAAEHLQALVDLQPMSTRLWLLLVTVCDGYSMHVSRGTVALAAHAVGLHVRDLDRALGELERTGLAVSEPTCDWWFIQRPAWMLARRAASVESGARPVVLAPDRRRQRLYRKSQVAAAVKVRDGEFCRYCGVHVSWSDRRGATGATYDHVDPNGPETLENIVVACRSCNSAKGARVWHPRPIQQTNQDVLGRHDLVRFQDGALSDTKKGLIRREAHLNGESAYTGGELDLDENEPGSVILPPDPPSTTDSPDITVGCNSLTTAPAPARTRTRERQADLELFRTCWNMAQPVEGDWPPQIRSLRASGERGRHVLSAVARITAKDPEIRVNLLTRAMMFYLGNLADTGAQLSNPVVTFCRQFDRWAERAEQGVEELAGSWR